MLGEIGELVGLGDTGCYDATTGLPVPCPDASNSGSGNGDGVLSTNGAPGTTAITPDQLNNIKNFYYTQGQAAGSGIGMDTTTLLVIGGAFLLVIVLAESGGRRR